MRCKLLLMALAIPASAAMFCAWLAPGLLAQDKPAPAPTKTVTDSINVRNFLTAPGQNIPKNADIGLYITRFVNFLALLIGSFAFLTIVVGGITLLTSGGKEAQVTKGKDMIKFAVIGVALALSAYWITSFVQSIFYEYGG